MNQNYNEMNYIIDNNNIDEMNISLSIIEIIDLKIDADNNLNELKNNIINNNDSVEAEKGEQNKYI